MKIVNVEEMRRIEQACDAAGHTYSAMMDMAGHAVAEAASTLILPGAADSVLVLVGPGNNGGDGLVAARYLVEAEVLVTLYIWKRNIKGDKVFQKLKRTGRRSGLSILWADNDPNYVHLREHLQTADLIIDALLGTGAVRPIDGQLAEILGVVKEGLAERRKQPPAIPELGRPLQFPLGSAYTLGMELPGNARSHDDDDDDWDDDFDDLLDPAAPTEDGEDESAFDLDDLDEFDDFDELDEDDDELRPHWPPLPILAVDCPSGLNADTGEIDPAALPAQLTITFAFPKWGQLEQPGALACGILGVADIGVPPELAIGIQAELAEPRAVKGLLPDRPVGANKGTFGKAMIAAGSLNYTGAAYLSAAAAGRAGAGLVTLAVPAGLHPALAAALPEVTWQLLPESQGTHCADGAGRLLAALAGYRALLIGPGLTAGPDATGFVTTLFGPDGLDRDGWRGRLVVDADCLNILSGLPAWPALLPPEAILTPHPGEMARLTGLTAAEINRQRIAMARKYAAEWGHIVLLKGPFSVVAAPDGRTAVLPIQTPALATAGSGDVLAGAIVAMLAQGLPAFDAAVCAGYIHGHAGYLIEREIGLAGGVASDILQRLPRALRQLWHA